MLRKAKVTDAEKIYRLIAFWAKRGKVLPRPLNYIYEHIRSFWVYQEKKRIVGTCALHIVGWEDLAEIKSLVVVKEYQRKGIGKKLVHACIEEAKSLGIKRVFALTFVGAFFRRLGFKKISKEKLPHKIWSECVTCPYFPHCKEKAFILKINS